MKKERQRGSEGKARKWASRLAGRDGRMSQSRGGGVEARRRRRSRRRKGGERQDKWSSSRGAMEINEGWSKKPKKKNVCVCV